MKANLLNSVSKIEAEKIAEITSGIFQQGRLWVLREWDMKFGIERLTRGLTYKDAKRRLCLWRRERMELLLREGGSNKAYTVREWHQNHSWAGEGVWRWSQSFWYTTKAEAEVALAEIKSEREEKNFQIYEISTMDLPGHFSVA